MRGDTVVIIEKLLDDYIKKRQTYKLPVVALVMTVILVGTSLTLDLLGYKIFGVVIFIITLIGLILYIYFIHVKRYVKSFANTTQQNKENLIEVIKNYKINIDDQDQLKELIEYIKNYREKYKITFFGFSNDSRLAGIIGGLFGAFITFLFNVIRGSATGADAIKTGLALIAVIIFLVVLFYALLTIVDEVFNQRGHRFNEIVVILEELIVFKDYMKATSKQTKHKEGQDAANGSGA